MSVTKQKILIIGAGGGREHAIGWKIAQSERAGKLFFARGNAGTAKLGTNLDVKETDIPALLEFAVKEDVDLVLIVSDDPLALGAVDQFQAAGFRTWGPTGKASQLEWSKAYAKDFMKRHKLPTAKFETFTDFEKATEYLRNQKFPIVIKASGLALGKGVVIAQRFEDANRTLEEFMVRKVFGTSGETVVIEEFMQGPEISIHAFLDGENYKMFPASQDHKQIGENDTGPNTGGIGTITPLPFVDNALMQKIEKEIVAKTVAGLKKDGIPFTGILYPGLMLTKEGPKLLEFNARFGDPETQIYLRILENDLLDIIDASIDGKLNGIEVTWSDKAACNIVVCAEGYPVKYEKGMGIRGIEDATEEKDIVVFFAGVAEKEGKLVTNGGRVMGVSAVGETLENALRKAYRAIQKISFEGIYYRKDIGKKALSLKNGE